MDRLSLDLSMEGSGPLTRSLSDADTSGFIRDDAPHWSIETFIPLQVKPLIEYLLARGELSPDRENAFRQACDDIDNIVHRQTSSYHTRFSQAYIPLDPDSDTKNPAAQGTVPAEQSPTETDSETSSETAASTTADVAITVCDEALIQAGYQKLSQEDIEKCVGVASQWGVPLHVDFDVFQRLEVFARGDIVGTRVRRRIRKLYCQEQVAVPIYQRMVVLFQLCDDDSSAESLSATSLHLRMFKNIPKQDIDMLLPGTKIRLSGMDRIKIVLPSLSGFLMSLRKIELIIKTVLLFAAIALNWTAILLALVLGYVVKSVFSYSQTKNRYQLNLNRNLYFQKLDTNAGVAYRMIQQAHRQSVVELTLAYYAIASSSEPISTRRLRRKCERLVRESIDVEVDFQVDRSVALLLQMKVVEQVHDQWVLTPNGH
ncbi:MAG: DUF3754 domain-containing protein [Rubripirellula sp.]